MGGTRQARRHTVRISEGGQRVTSEHNGSGDTSKKELVLDLVKSLYGLKQAGRLWSQFLHSKLLEADFKQCVADTCLHWKLDGTDTIVMGVYVDDVLATGTSAAAVDRFFASLAGLSIKDLCRVSKFLEISVTLEDDGGYTLGQEDAIGDLLHEHGLEDANSILTPIGVDCYEVQPTDTALLKVKNKNEAPTIEDF